MPDASSAVEVRALLEVAAGWYLEIEGKVDLGEAYDGAWDVEALQALKALAACPDLSPSQAVLAEDALTGFSGYLNQDYDYNLLFEAKVPLRSLAGAVGFNFDAAEKPFLDALSEVEARERGLAQ